MSPPLPPAIGRYEVRERIGQGGMGALFLALDPAIDRLVALKLLRVDSDEMRARFLREARSAGRLHHPYIVTVYDVGEHDGQPFIAMEYVKGETLGEIIRRRAPLSMSARIRLMEYLCEGLQYAHDAGLVHRDIKPANLMVTFRGEGLKILDFGIARGAGDAGLTEVGMMMGTPNYMSPEQASGKTVDLRSDIFAVGAVIYEMLLYRQAYPGKDWQVVLPRILQGAPDPPTQVDPAIDPRVDEIIRKAMTRAPEDRYQELRTLASDMQRVREELETTQADTTMTPTATPAPSVAAATPRTTPGATKQRPITDRARLDTLRKQKVQRHVHSAEAALARGDVDAALVEAEEASLLDVEDTQVIRLLESVGTARDVKQFDDHLEAARHRLEDEALTEALTHVDQALELQPEAAAALDLRGTVVAAFEERDRQRERSRMIERTIDEARRALESGALETAMRAASEALAYEPDHPEAASLKQQALDAIGKRRRRKSSERTAQRAVERARKEFEDGDHRAAFRRLEKLVSTHPIVAQTLSELRNEAAAIERELRSGKAAQERLASWVAQQLETVRGAIEEKQWDDAAAQVAELRTRAPRTPELPALEEEVGQGVVQSRRLAEVEEYLSEARRNKAAEDFPAALSRVDAALALWPDHDDATALRQEIEELAASTEQRREAEAAARRKAGQEAVSVWLDEADTALRGGRFDQALTALSEIDVEVATSTQALRFGDLTRDAKSRREKAKAEKAARRQQRIDEARSRVDELWRTGLSTAQQAAGDRNVQIGAAVALLVLVVVWWLIPSSPSIDQATNGAGSEDVSSMASAVPPINPSSSFPRGAPESTPSRSDVASSLPAAAEDGESDPDTELPADVVSHDVATTDSVAAVTEDPPAPTPVVDSLQQDIEAVTELADAGDFGEAFRRLESLDGQSPRVARARAAVDMAWNSAADQTAAGARELASAGDFGAALALVEGFNPEHGFVESARDYVEREWATSGEALSRRALELAAAGDHDGAVALLEASVPPPPAVVATLDQLLASPACSDDVPGVREALTSLTLAGGVSPPPFAASCGGPFRFEIQNEQVRFGLGCERASASAFVPLLCEDSTEWTTPSLLRFVLRKSGGSWAITEAVEMESSAAR